MCIFHNKFHYKDNIIYSREQYNTQLRRHMCIFHYHGNTIYSREQYYPKNQLNKHENRMIFENPKTQLNKKTFE